MNHAPTTYCDRHGVVHRACNKDDLDRIPCRDLGNKDTLDARRTPRHNSAGQRVTPSPDDAV